MAGSSGTSSSFRDFFYFLKVSYIYVANDLVVVVDVAVRSVADRCDGDCRRRQHHLLERIRAIEIPLELLLPRHPLCLAGQAEARAGTDYGQLGQGRSLGYRANY